MEKKRKEKKYKVQIFMCVYWSFGAPATMPLSIPHSFLPRRILKKPLSPQSWFHAKYKQKLVQNIARKWIRYLQLAISQYGVPFSTPHPRILMAKNQRLSVKNMQVRIKSDAYHGRQVWYPMCVCKHLNCIEGNPSRQWMHLRQVHSSWFQFEFVVHLI